MAKNKIKDTNKSEGRIAAIVILIIMVLSVAGFAVLMGGPSVNTSSPGSNSNSPSEVPMGLIFQNSQTGEQLLGTVRNKEQFIFPDISGYDTDTQMLDLAENIKSKDIIEIYIDPNFNSSGSIFLIEKALKGIKKIYTQTNDSTCTKNKLIITNNESINPNCAIFSAAKNDEYRRADILVYHLVK